MPSIIGISGSETGRCWIRKDADTIARHGAEGTRRGDVRSCHRRRLRDEGRCRGARNGDARRRARDRRGRAAPARDDEPARAHRRCDGHREDADAAADRGAAVRRRRRGVHRGRQGRPLGLAVPGSPDGPAKKRSSELGLQFTPTGFPVEYLSLGGIGPGCPSARPCPTSARSFSGRCSVRTRRRSRASLSSSTTPTRRAFRCSTSPTCARC